MESVSTLPQVSCSKTNVNRFLGGLGAAAGLLLPKCPLCWMALAGSFTAAGYTQWSIEIAGLAVFLFAIWKILRQRSTSLFKTCLYLSLAGGTLACGAWLPLPQPARLTLWAIVLLASLWLSRGLSRTQCACMETP